MACPFCYIGKRRFEEAVRAFPQAAGVEVVWKSFQLNPGLVYREGDTLHHYLARHKGWSDQEVQQANTQVTRMAAEAGLEFHLEKAIPANTETAHRLLQLSAKYQLQNQVGEALFHAYFTEGHNVGDTATLLAIAASCGLPAEETAQLFSSTAWTEEVQRDMEEAQQLGVRGVPFFVFDRRYAVSGAQPVAVFRQALEQVLADNASATSSEGAACEVDGEC